MMQSDLLNKLNTFPPDSCEFLSMDYVSCSIDLDFSTEFDSFFCSHLITIFTCVIDYDFVINVSGIYTTLSNFFHQYYNIL